MDQFENPVTAFIAAVSARLDECIFSFKAGDYDAALRALEVTVALCEQHPAYALRHSNRLGSSLHKVVRGCISNAIAKRRAPEKMSGLLARMDAIERTQVH